MYIYTRGKEAPEWASSTWCFLRPPYPHCVPVPCQLSGRSSRPPSKVSALGLPMPADTASAPYTHQEGQEVHPSGGLGERVSVAQLLCPGLELPHPGLELSVGCPSRTKHMLSTVLRTVSGALVAFPPSSLTSPDPCW